ncbi:MAG: ABC transporter substrate-binding protein [Candidatus Gracilibacteria bacterium]
MVTPISKRLGIAALGFVMAASLSACADIDDEGSSSTQQQTSTTQTQAVTGKTEGETMKIGGILPLSGDGAAYGEPLQKVAQIALDEVNAKGGVQGKKLEIIWEDGKCNGNDAAIAANKLINIDKVKVIYGGFCSSETLAVAPIAEAAKVVVLSPGSSSPDITNAGQYIFRNYPSDATQGKVLAEGAKEKGFKKVGVLSEQNDYTLGIQRVFDAKFKELGGEVVTSTYLPDDTDFRTSLLKLKSEGVDALLVDPQTPAKADLIFKQLEEMKWDVKLMGNDVVAGYQDLISKYAKLVEGMVVAEFTYDKENPEFKKLAAKFKEVAGKELPYGTYASTCYDAVYILQEALEKSGNDAEAIKTYLAGIKDRKGLGGSLTFDENGDPKAGHSLEMVKDGKVAAYTK